MVYWSMNKFISLPGYLFNCGVYAWFRNKKCLYVGYSTKLLARLGTHHLLDQHQPVLSADTIDIWLCETKKEAQKLEIELIEKLKPAYNSNSHETYGKAKELREKMQELHTSGLSYRKIGKMFGFCQSTVWKVCTNRGKNTLSRGPYFGKDTKKNKIKKTFSRQEAFATLHEKAMLQ